jgi:hypothetical protein
MGFIKLTQKRPIMPNVGFESFNAKRIVFTSYDDPLYKRYDGVGLFYLGASAKYCFNNYLFAKGGPVFYAAGGNEDISGLAIGGNIAGGVNLNSTRIAALKLQHLPRLFILKNPSVMALHL